MRILMMSWRDIKNPLAGGAEKVTFELLRRFAKAGHSCTWFSSEFERGPSSEKIEGVKIVRRGSRFGVYFAAYSFLRNKKYDSVIDQVNTIPFFTPLYYSGRKAAFFHQLAEDIWIYEMPFPLSWLGYLAEKVYVRLYRHIPTITVSDSTKKNLAKYGIRDVFVFQNCIDSKPLKKVAVKEKNQLAYVGRLKKSKRVDDIIRSFSIVRRSADSVLHIIGTGDQEKELKKLVISLGLSDSVVFHGFLDVNARNHLVAESEALLMASAKEGFGLVVLEAASQGTPTITYDVDGLRDAVISGKTGLIVRKNNPSFLAKAIVSFLKDDALKGRLSKNALAYSKRFNWDDSAAKVMRFLGI